MDDSQNIEETGACEQTGQAEPGKTSSAQDAEARWTQVWKQVQQSLAQANFNETESLLQTVLTLAEALPMRDSRRALSLETLAQLYFSHGKFAQAEPLVKGIISLHERNLGPEHPDVGVYINNLALLYHRQKKHYLAESEYQRAIAIQTKQLGLDHPHTLNVLNNYAGLLRETHRHQAAKQLEEKYRLNTEDRNQKNSAAYQTYRPLSQLNTRETRIPRYKRGTYNVTDDAETLQNMALPDRFLAEFQGESLTGVPIMPDSARHQPKEPIKLPVPQESSAPSNQPIKGSEPTPAAQEQPKSVPDIKVGNKGEGLRRLLNNREPNT